MRAELAAKFFRCGDDVIVVRGARPGDTLATALRRSRARELARRRRARARELGEPASTVRSARAALEDAIRSSDEVLAALRRARARDP